MADKLVDAAVHGILDAENGLWGPYWSDTQKAIIVFVDAGGDLNFARTTDGGVNWATTEIVAGTVMTVSAWFDKETPGNTGTLVHIAWLDSVTDECTYVTVDVSDATVGTIRVVASPTVGAGAIENRVAVSRAVNDDVMIAFATTFANETHTSDDLFATDNVTRAALWDTTNSDWVLLYPADVDAGDFVAIYWDRSADEITVKIFDSSAGGGSPPVGTWSETTISGSMVDDAQWMNMDASVRHSDKVILLAAHSAEDTSGDDLLTWAITVDTIPVGGGDIVAKTNVFTNQAESAQVSVHINQQNNDVRIAYLKGGTWFGLVDAVFHLSDDDLVTWETEEAYSEATADDIRLVTAGRTVGDAGGRYQPVFNNDDFEDIFVNLVNDIEIAAAVAGGTRRTGLLTLGVS